MTEVLRAALLRSLERRYIAQGQLALPAVPALLDHYLHLITTHFKNLGRSMDQRQTASLHALLAQSLERAYAAAPQSNVLLRYHVERVRSAPIHYEIATGESTLEEEYDYWVSTRVGSLFGSHPDAKVMNVASSFGEPERVRVLDVGAGTGRNSLPLARRGHPVLALELAPALVDVLLDDIAEHTLDLRVLRGNVFDPDLGLPNGAFELVVVAEVVPHLRNVEQLRQLFATVSNFVVPGGSILMSAFLTKPGYTPDELSRQIAQVTWSGFFTRDELSAASSGQGLTLVSEESVLEYERAQLPHDAFPPTRWFESWASGSDAFDLPFGEAPIELCWLLFHRRE